MPRNASTMFKSMRPRKKTVTAPPDQPHPSDLPSGMDLNGHVLDKQEMAEKWRRQGLCVTCGRNRTHKVSLRGAVRQPLTVHGKSYKGKCLSCMSMTQAKSELGESVDANDLRQSVSDQHVTMGAAGRTFRRNNSGASGRSNKGDRSAAVVSQGGGGQRVPPGGVVRSEAEPDGLGDYPAVRTPSAGGDNQAGAGPAEHGGYPQGRKAPVQQLSGPPHRTPEVPHYIAPYGGLQGYRDDPDNMTVVSELTLDPSFAKAESKDSESVSNIEEEGLGKIEEEQSIEPSGSHDRSNHSASGNNSANRSFARSLSSGSGRQVGAVPIKGGDRIMNRKLAAAHNSSRGHRNSDGSSSQGLQEAGRVHFEDDENVMTARAAQAARNDDGLTFRGAQPSRMGGMLEARLRAKIDAADARSNSGDRAKTATPASGFGQSDSGSQNKRSKSAGATGDTSSHGASSEDLFQWEEKIKRKNSEGDRPNRRMTTEEAKDRFNERLGRKAAAANAEHSSSWDSGSSERKMKADADSSENDVAPGVQRVKEDGEYVTLFDRKMANNENPQAKGRNEGGKGDSQYLSLLDRKMAGDKSKQMEAQEVKLREMDLISECSCCSDVLDALKRNASSTQAVVMMALKKLLECVLNEHGLTEDAINHRASVDSLDVSKIALRGGGWVKIMMMVMSSSSSTVVQTEVLRVLWKIVTLHQRYTSDLIENAELKQIVTTMETHMEEEGIQAYGCGLLSCISASDRHALRLLGMCHGQFVCRLMAALYFRGGVGHVQESAFKALFQLSSASLSSRLSSASLSSSTTSEFFGKQMGRCAENNIGGRDPSVNAIAAVIETMDQYIQNPSVQIHGNRLLWNIFAPEAIDDKDYVDLLVGNTLNHFKKVMAQHKSSQGSHETIGCVLSKISYCVTSESEENLLHVVVDNMRAYSNSWIVALHGCRCLSNVYAKWSSKSSLISQESEDGTAEIISCMHHFQEHRGIQSEACAALTALCINSPPHKAKVRNLGGIDRINGAYDLYTSNPNEKHCVMTKVRACTALTTLAVDLMVLSDIRDKGLVTKFRLLEEDPNIPANLRDVIQAFLNLASAEDGHSLIFRDASDESETCHCIRANLRVITSPDFTPNKIPTLRSSVLRAMRRFPSSSSVHQDGCKLLACVFALASKNDAVPQEEILPEVLETIVLSLAEHKNIASNAAAACSALQNFCVMLSESDSCNASGLNELLSKSLSEVVSTIVIYHQNGENMERATGALQAVCATREGLALSLETDTTIELLIEAMNQFPDFLDLQRHGIGVLGLFSFVSNKLLNFLSDALVTAILRFIKSEVDNDSSADLIDMAISMLLIITNKGFQGVTTLLRNENLVDSIVSCMFKYPESPSVQCAGIDILSNISLDNYIRADVCQRGGTSRIICALKKLEHDSQLACKAFAALANLTSGADVEILRAPDAPAPSVMVNALKAHPKNLTVQVGGAYALWALSARSDSFKHEIVNCGGAEAISAAMTEFVACKQLQAKGFVVIWSLAVPKPLKTRVGRCAVTPAVNGLTAHMSSEKLCEEALGCLKCLSTIPANKDLLEENGAVDQIYACLWRHSTNAAVCKAALAALCNISVNVDTNEVSEITKEDLQAIVVAMRSHQTARPVQESAIILLRNFTFSRNNVQILEQNPFVVPLVQSAMSTFNDHFQGRAEDLLRVLPPGQ